MLRAPGGTGWPNALWPSKLFPEIPNRTRVITRNSDLCFIFKMSDDSDQLHAWSEKKKAVFVHACVRIYVRASAAWMRCVRACDVCLYRYACLNAYAYVRACVRDEGCACVLHLKRNELILTHRPQIMNKNREINKTLNTWKRLRHNTMTSTRRRTPLFAVAFQNNSWNFWRKQEEV